MEVILKFTLDQIIAMSFLLNKCYNLNPESLSYQEKIDISIGMVLSDRFEKRKRKLLKNVDLLNVNKKTEMTLIFFEVCGMKNIFLNQIHLLDNDYQKLQIQNVINILDPKSIEK